MAKTSRCMVAERTISVVILVAGPSSSQWMNPYSAFCTCGSASSVLTCPSNVHRCLVLSAMTHMRTEALSNNCRMLLYVVFAIASSIDASRTAVENTRSDSVWRFGFHEVNIINMRGYLLHHEHLWQ